MKDFHFPSRLYAIVDTLGDPSLSFVELASAMVAGGAPLLQLRAKSASTRELIAMAQALRELTRRSGTLLIINDRADIAKLVDADGVHLGQNDLPAAAARAILGPNKIVGVSTHTLEQATAAAHEGVADYLAFGPLFATLSKDNPAPVVGLAQLSTIRTHVTLPIVAIGGITAATMPQALAAGADAVAMIGAIVRSPDVAATVRALLSISCGASNV